MMFNSLNSRSKSPCCAVKTDEKVSFLLRIPSDFESVVMEYNAMDSDNISFDTMEYIGHEGECKVFKTALSFPFPGVFFYVFRLTHYDGTAYYLNRGPLQDGVLENYRGTPWQQTVYKKEYQSPTGFAGKIMYQIFPDRFYREKLLSDPEKDIRSDWGGVPYFNDDRFHPEHFIGSDFFGGNLQGIQAKLPYLQSLGVSLIYLNPIFCSSSDHRYDTADYMRIDPVLGDEEDFVSLCREAHKSGIKIILDGVFSHVGADSLYFDIKEKYGTQGACHHPDSPYRSWFTFDHSDIGYRCWWGVFSLPEINESELSYCDFICGENGVIAHWMRLGADGFRLDVADELPDEFLDAVRCRLKTENPNALLLGEVWEDATTKFSHGGRRRYLLGDQLDGVMNYPFKNAVLNFMLRRDAFGFGETVTKIYNNYPTEMLDTTMNFLSTHDTVRAISVLSGSAACGFSRKEQATASLSEEEYKRGVSLFKTALGLLFMLNGIPSVYYGDEAGLCGFSDPFNRLCYPWNHQDTALLNFVQNLCRFRNEHSAVFSDGSFRVLSCEGAVVTVERVGKEYSLICTVNMSETAVDVCKEWFENPVFGNLQEGKLASEEFVIGRIG